MKVMITDPAKEQLKLITSITAERATVKQAAKLEKT